VAAAALEHRLTAQEVQAAAVLVMAHQEPLIQAAAVALAAARVAAVRLLFVPSSAVQRLVSQRVVALRLLMSVTV